MFDARNVNQTKRSGVTKQPPSQILRSFPAKLKGAIYLGPLPPTAPRYHVVFHRNRCLYGFLQLPGTFLCSSGQPNSQHTLQQQATPIHVCYIARPMPSQGAGHPCDSSTCSLPKACLRVHQSCAQGVEKATQKRGLGFTRLNRVTAVCFSGGGVRKE